MTATLSYGTGVLRNEITRRSRRSFRTPVVWLLLALLPFVTVPGQIIADTKLNLVVSPDGFLSRALTLWDPQFFGELQNQAVGYLFPMGPFFALGKLATIPSWIIQRLWIGALLIAAYTGTAWLARRLDIGTPWTRTLGGLAYALSPLALSMTGELSAEFLPMTMLPWILLPLAGAVRGQITPARAAARSAVAVALCSGMNAASTVAVLVPAAIYILTCTRGVPSRRKLGLWWAALSLLATSWWSVPLILLSRYGVSPVPYTESAAATTSVTSLSNVLRGTSDWLSYLAVNGQPWWPLGFRIATEVLPVLLTGVIAALGLSGLLTRVPERRFLLCTLLAGVGIIAAGYVGSLGNPLAGTLDHLINGAASPFRNLWKFDPMVRLPLAFGLAHVLARSGRWSGARFAAAGLAIAGVAIPAYVSGLAAVGSFTSIPSYWTQAADWLNTHAENQGVLIEPGAAFGQYEWGSPLDEVLSSLTSADYAERDLADIGSPGNERLLNTIDQEFAAGDGSAGLTQVLALMGVKYLVIRNDLQRSTLNSAWPARVHQTIVESPGLTRVAKFGTFTGTFAPDDAATNFDAPYPPVEIYQVAGALPVATVQPAAGTLRVYGGPEALLTLADDNLLGERPVLLNDDGAGEPTAGSVVTDTLRRRARNFGEIRASYSPTLTATQPADTFEATDDYTEPGWSRYQSVARYTGIRDVTASSSASDVSAIPSQWSSSEMPFSAVDGNTRTYWESGSWNGPVGQWIAENFDSAIDLRVISVAFDANPALGPSVTQVRVWSAAGSVTDPVTVTSKPQLLRVPVGRSSWLRITVTGLASRPNPPIGAQAGIYEIYVPGVHAARTIVAPPVPGSTAVLSQDEPQPSGCMLTSLRWVCSPSLRTSTEEEYGFDRTFEEQYTERGVVHGSAILTDSSLVDKFIRLSPSQPRVTASSVYTSDPQDQAVSAFDANPATTWVASPTDSHPTLRIRWSSARTVSRVTIQRPPGASGLLEVMIAGSNGQVRGAWIGSSGKVTFAPMRTTSLTFKFNPSSAPVQITDVDIPGVLHFSPPKGAFRLPCGLGPAITLNGKQVRTKVSGTFADLLTEQPVQFTACSRVTLAAGANHLVEPENDAFTIQNAVVSGSGTPSPAPASAPVAARIVSWTSTARTLQVSAASRSYLVVNENFNSGWQAVVNGVTLTPVRLDGWKQGWILPAGTTGIVYLTFRPQSLFLAAVVVGLAVLTAIVLAAVWPFRRQIRPVPRRARTLPSAIRMLLRAAGLVALCGMGLWLGGYPGAVIVPLAAIVFTASKVPKGPWVVAGLMLAAAFFDAIGTHLQSAGDTGLPVSVPLDGIPQVLLLIVIGRLAAALLPEGDEHA